MGAVRAVHASWGREDASAQRSTCDGCLWKNGRSSGTIVDFIKTKAVWSDIDKSALLKCNACQSSRFKKLIVHYTNKNITESFISFVYGVEYDATRFDIGVPVQRRDDVAGAARDRLMRDVNDAH
jgi:hypothetical protein